MCPYCVPGPNGPLEHENIYPQRISLLSEPVRTASRNREGHQRKPQTIDRYPSAPPTQFIIHEFSSKSNPGLTFGGRPTDTSRLGSGATAVVSTWRGLVRRLYDSDGLNPLAPQG